MNGWQEVALQDALECLIDYRGKSPKKSEVGIPVISAKVVKSGRILNEIEQTIAPDYYLEWMRRGLPNVGDVVMTTEGPLGEVAQLDHETVKYALGQRIVTMRGRSGFLDNGFLKYLLLSAEVQERLHSRATGSTVAGISQASLRAMPVPIAPYAEQRQIASILGALDDKIDLNRRMAATLEEMARALYRSWFVDFDPVKAKAEGLAPAFMDEATAALFPDRFGDDGLPEGWRMGCVTDVFDVVMGQSPPGNTYNDRGEGLPFYQGRTDFGFRFPSQRVFCSAPTRIAPRDSVLLSVRAPVGDLNRAWEECCIGRGVASLSEKEGRNAYGYEALWALSEDLKAYDSEGTVFGAINKNQLTGLSLIIPPKSMRAAFEERVRPMDDRIRNVTAVTRTLTTLRDTLLPKLMSGELRVGEARDQVEEVA